MEDGNTTRSRRKDGSYHVAVALALTFGATQSQAEILAEWGWRESEDFARGACEALGVPPNIFTSYREELTRRRRQFPQS